MLLRHLEAPRQQIEIVLPLVREFLAARGRTLPRLPVGISGPAAMAIVAAEKLSAAGWVGAAGLVSDLKTGSLSHAPGALLN